MKHAVELLCCLLLMCALCLSLAGCGSSLVGEWSSGSLNFLVPSFLTLEDDGSCSMDGVPMYQWSVDGDTLVIEAPSLDYRTEYSYELKGNTLTLDGKYEYTK